MLETFHVIDFHSISSDPVQVCFCRNSQPDCSYQPPAIKVNRGEMFRIPLLAEDQANHVVANPTIHSSLSSSKGDEQ